MHPAALTLLMHFARGEHLAETVSSSDRVAWVLPKVKLEAARRNGIVIVEDTVSVTIAALSVVSADAATATIHSIARTVTLDVPRRTSATTRSNAAAAYRTDGGHSASSLSPVDAVLADLPHADLSLGARWTTHELVLTKLGSGEMEIVHTVTALSDASATIDVKGFGSITGVEYDLPHLLPGKMFISGTAVFDRVSGTFVRETYALHNSLIKPDRDEHIGFDEHENVAITTVVDP
ncbi:MAG TPA: hypothetical protein VKT51_00320 [Candidatus Eremiobacteraceae bacterium]|nr:hypothetical protein [Candidatus Eremiobacteraceae bacterium]